VRRQCIRKLLCIALGSAAYFGDTPCTCQKLVCVIADRDQLPTVTNLWECFAQQHFRVAESPADRAFIISELVIGSGPICKARDCNSYVCV